MVCTHGGGISKFDGENWTHYNTTNSKLLGEYIDQIEVDRNNTVWILSSEGINTIDSNNNWKQYYSKNSIFKDLHINTMMADTNGSMWLGGENLLNLINDSVTFYSFKDTSYVSRMLVSIISITKNNKGELFLGTYHGYGKLNKEDEEIIFETDVKLKFYDVHQIAFDKDNIMWLSNYDYRPPFDNYDIDHSEGCIIKFDKSAIYYDTTNSSLVESFAEVIKIDRDNKVWFGTRDGLCYFDGNKWGIFIKENSGLPSNQVSALAFDKLWNLWIGTTKGVAVYRKDGVILK